jgi:hypothetical protein
LAGKAEISAARRAPEASAVPAIAAALVWAIAVRVLAIEEQAAATWAAVLIAWAIAVLATPLRWVIAVDLAAGRAATTGAALVPAARVAHPAWAATAAPVAADMVEAVTAAVVAAADMVAAAAVAVVAAGEAGGKHHEQRKSNY